MNERAMDERWKDVLADSEATVEGYRERGWDAIGVHPGDVNPIEGAARLDVLLPGSEFDEVHERMADVEIEEFRVYAAYQGGVAFRLVAAEDATGGFALCVPTFLFDQDREPLRRAAAQAGALVIRLRPLDDRDVVELTLSDPDVFFEAEPPAEG